MNQALERGGDAAGAVAVETRGFGVAKDGAGVAKTAVLGDRVRIAPGEIVVLNNGAIGVPA
ncbi:MAG TPA: hypothetical protein VGX46_03015, partial [Vicinamibacterales bacterium]|nr:hypothetical protein [Vicinamibacterales bacterium]